MTEPALPAVVLGLLLGLQHASDPDHVVAVATIVSRRTRPAEGLMVGLLWGLGHGLTLTAAGLALFVLRPRLDPGLERGLEVAVGLALVAVGALRLRDARHGLGRAPADHLLADHEHHEAAAAGGTLHAHAHHHGGAAHAHLHLHPSRRLLRALDGDAGRALLVGGVHGLAGTAGVALLVLATLGSLPAAFGYLAVFTAGTMAGMALLAAALAWPVALISRVQRWRRVLAVGAGLGAVAFGLTHAARAL